MKRKELIRYLRSEGCEFLREGGRHSWWYNPNLNRRSSIPRHKEIKDLLIEKICKDLGIASPKERR
jgi:mRNA interferase HicA